MSNLFNNLSVVLRPWSRESEAFGEDVALKEPKDGRRFRRPNKISPLASVDPKAELGEGVEVGPFCVVGPKVTLGDGCRLIAHVTLVGRTTVGEENVFYPNCVIGCDPQDKKFDGEVTGLEIGDRNQIREAVTIHVGTEQGGGVTRVGSDNLLMINTHLGHDCQWGNHTIVSNNTMVAGHVHCGDYVSLMGGVGVHHFVTIGERAYVGGYARIHHDVPPFVKIDGADEVRGTNAIGLQRGGFSGPDVEAIDRAVRKLFFQKGVPISRTMKELSVTNENPFVKQMVDFLYRRDLGRHGRFLEGQRAR